MANKIKLTFTSGEQIGDVVERSFGETLVVGRSHSAEIRVREPDVSGRHIEISFRDGRYSVHNLSRFSARVDGQRLATGEEAPLRRQSVVELGSELRFRVDELSGEADAPAAEVTDGTCAPGEPTQATRLYAERGTEATAFAGEETFATRVPRDLQRNETVSTGCVGESATRDISEMFDDGRSAPVPPAAAATAAVPPAEPSADEADTADDLQGATGAGVSQRGFGDETDSNDGTSDGETQEMVTRIGSLDELLERRRQLERKSAARHWRFGLCIALVLAALGAVWYVRANHGHVEDAEGPFLADGKTEDTVLLDIEGDTGNPDLYLEYPRDDRARVVMSARTNEVEVTSYLGRDRDVPFRLWFTRRRDAGELQMSLVDSFDRWMDRQSREKGFTFERYRNGKPVELEFFDGVFAPRCEKTTQRGFTFVRADSSRSVGHVVWRGICYYFRCGDVAYCICDEIPEMYWTRGERRLRWNPFFALYSGFIGRQWDSPGSSELVRGIGDAELIERIRHALSVETPGDFANLEKWVDTLLVSTWGKETGDARTALTLRRSLSAAKQKFYNERRLAYETARVNGEQKQMRSVFWDCLKVFGELKRDRRRTLVNNPEEWECQLDR